MRRRRRHAQFVANLELGGDAIQFGNGKTNAEQSGERRHMFLVFIECGAAIHDQLSNSAPIPEKRSR